MTGILKAVENQRLAVAHLNAFCSLVTLSGDPPNPMYSSLKRFFISCSREVESTSSARSCIWGWSSMLLQRARTGDMLSFGFCCQCKGSQSQDCVLTCVPTDANQKADVSLLASLLVHPAWNSVGKIPPAICRKARLCQLLYYLALLLLCLGLQSRSPRSLGNPRQ